MGRRRVKAKDTDTVAARLTPGEFVVKKSAAKKLGPGALAKINKGQLPKQRGRK